MLTMVAPSRLMTSTVWLPAFSRGGISSSNHLLVPSHIFSKSHVAARDNDGRQICSKMIFITYLNVPLCNAQPGEEGTIIDVWQMKLHRWLLSDKRSTEEILRLFLLMGSVMGVSDSDLSYGSCPRISIWFRAMIINGLVRSPLSSSGRSLLLSQYIYSPSLQDTIKSFDISNNCHLRLCCMLVVQHYVLWFVLSADVWNYPIRLGI